jgi:glycosyltransferase involved in cell wall biosynthesis
MSLRSLSVVVPCRNEERNLPELLRRIESALEAKASSLQIVVVDDGSTDATATLAVEASLGHAEVMCLRLSRHFGKEAALCAGLQMATGDLVALMDGDLQHPPEVLAEMVDVLTSTGVDQVVGVRSRDGESRLRRWTSRIYARALSGVSDVPLAQGQGDFRVVTRRVVAAVSKLTEANRFNRGLFAWVGFPTVQFEYADSARKVGPSRWTPGQLLGYGIDGLLSFSPRPLRFLMLLGASLMAVFFAYLLIVILRVLIFGVDAPGYATLIAAVFFVGGMQAFSAGLLGEYLGRIFLEVKRRPLYVVMDEANTRGEQ